MIALMGHDYDVDDPACALGGGRKKRGSKNFSESQKKHKLMELLDEISR